MTSLINRQFSHKSSRINYLFFLFIIVQSIFIIIFANKGLTPILLILLALAIFVFTFFSASKTYYLLAFYIGIAPYSQYMAYFPGIPISYSIKFAFPLFLMVLLYWFVYLIRSPQKTVLKSLDWAVLSYLLIVILSAVRGYFYGFKINYFIWDLTTQLWYLCYFVFRYSPLNTNIKKFFDIILIIALIVCLEFIYGFSQTKGLIIFKRVVARNIHLALIALPYIISTFIYRANKSRKLVFSFILPFIIMGIFVSQQRSLWLSVFIVSIILLLIFLYTRRLWIREHKKNILKIIIASLVFLFVLNIILQSSAKSKLFLTILSRLLVFLSPSVLKFDMSWLIREREISLALRDVIGQIIFGQGLGATIISPDRRFVLITPDNAYVYILWKMGVVGLISFLVMQFLFIKRCIFVLRRATIESDKIIALTGLLNIIGLLIVGFANACISQYEYLVIWTAIMGAVETTARKYE